MQKYHDEPKQYKGYLKSALTWSRPEEGRKALANFWRPRWLAPRIRRDGILDEVAGHRLTYPVTHGPRVVAPQVREDGDQMTLFEEASV